ncbi:hypothetical protein [Xanthobacter flavus]|uniref:hypothetical protein n=1 Tax=Xanthobacter flavus TaxID=281 RepID=UPI003726D67D
MRLSADSSSPDFHAWEVRNAKIYLDGREVQHFRLADEERGYVIVSPVDGAGRFLLEGDEIATQLCYGEVRILLPERSPRCDAAGGA